MLEVWFWHRIVSPHMAGLAIALANRGCKVTYVAEQAMSADRAQQGWAAPVIPGVDIIYANSTATTDLLVGKAPENSVHICQGIRANGFVVVAQRALAKRGFRQWVVMETVDDSGLQRIIKRTEYNRLFKASHNNLQGVLAIGHRTASWVAARGMPADRIYPFAYFLPSNHGLKVNDQRRHGPFRFVFAGQLIPRKRVDWLINAMASLVNQEFELWIIGAGTEEPALRSLATRKLSNRVRWFGVLPLPEVPDVMAQADCLLLPSIHDGWGAVVSEALMVGTPVICSDACGSAGVVQASGFGGVFPRDNVEVLQSKLIEQLQIEPINVLNRMQLSSWAKALGSEAGANYLIQILDHANGKIERPSPPWEMTCK